ncbi:hypothetical protein KO500_07285 [Cellulophaga baltica]|uniref:HEAT repeat domain-containing protein n=1 Tax=Cellulophaga TaxID=104264 RepID=UPI001C074A85|nr:MULTISPECIES: HEAT repeat domain-containing protein [Cellulophaga]MBU2996231.1 hypothetical protein [Cellulophaga baltica]MDO6767626.1 HEAT repeat domain-containing protein [Cellulophaga sp. 1_MG-2023]
MKLPTLNIYSLVKAPLIHQDLIWDLTFLFGGLSVVYFSCIFYYKSKLKKHNVDKAKRKKELTPLVSEFLFYNEKEGSLPEKNSYINKKIEIRELLKNHKNKAVLTEILLDLKIDVSGETRLVLFKLYRDLHLDEYAFECLHSFKWVKVARGMFQLTQMQATEYYGFISKFINDRRPVVREQAEISTVTLLHEGISYFLDNTKYKISEWQQLKILEVLTNLENFDPPRFYKWLTSKNKYVVLFSLRLIKHYDQNDGEKSIITLVKHKDAQIKKEAIHCIKKFNFTNSRKQLKAVFWKNKVDVKIAILDTLAEFGFEEDIAFLETVENKESNFLVKSKAISSINSILPGTVVPTENIEVLTPEENSSIKVNIKEETLKVDLTEEEEEIIEHILTEREVGIIDDNSIQTKGSKSSVFESLFNFCDLETKLFMIDQMVEIGSKKEALFLQTLIDHGNKAVRKRALQVKLQLEKSVDLLENGIDYEQNETTAKKEDVEVKIVENVNVLLRDNEIQVIHNTQLKSLEFCFLKEEVVVPKPFDILEVEFHMDTLKPFISKERQETEGFNNVVEANGGLTKDERNFFNKYLEFPNSSKDKFNG